MAYMERRDYCRIEKVYRNANETDSVMRKRIASIKSSIDTHAPSDSHLRRNTKKEVMMEERYAEIEKQNLLLLQRMHAILRAPPAFNAGPASTSPAGGAQSRPQQFGPRSMNIKNRREELMRISRDNHLILERIQGVQPMFDGATIRKDAKLQETYVKRLSQYANGRKGDPSKFNPIKPMRPSSAAAGLPSGVGSGNGSGGRGGGSRGSSRAAAAMAFGNGMGGNGSPAGGGGGGMMMGHGGQSQPLPPYHTYNNMVMGNNPNGLVAGGAALDGDDGVGLYSHRASVLGGGGSLTTRPTSAPVFASRYTTGMGGTAPAHLGSGGSIGHGGSSLLPGTNSSQSLVPGSAIYANALAASGLSVQQQGGPGSSSPSSSSGIGIPLVMTNGGGNANINGTNGFILPSTVQPTSNSGLGSMGFVPSLYSSSTSVNKSYTNSAGTDTPTNGLYVNTNVIGNQNGRPSTANSVPGNQSLHSGTVTPNAAYTMAAITKPSSASTAHNSGQTTPLGASSSAAAATSKSTSSTPMHISSQQQDPSVSRNPISAATTNPTPTAAAAVSGTTSGGGVEDSSDDALRPRSASTNPSTQQQQPGSRPTSARMMRPESAKGRRPGSGRPDSAGGASSSRAALVGATAVGTIHESTEDNNNNNNINSSNLSSEKTIAAAAAALLSASESNLVSSTTTAIHLHGDSNTSLGTDGVHLVSPTSAPDIDTSVGGGGDSNAAGAEISPSALTTGSGRPGSAGANRPVRPESARASSARGAGGVSASTSSTGSVTESGSARPWSSGRRVQFREGGGGANGAATESSSDVLVDEAAYDSTVAPGTPSSSTAAASSSEVVVSSTPSSSTAPATETGISSSPRPTHHGGIGAAESLTLSPGANNHNNIHQAATPAELSSPPRPVRVAAVEGTPSSNNAVGEQRIRAADGVVIGEDDLQDDSFIKEDPAGDDAESIGPDHHEPYVSSRAHDASADSEEAF